MKKQLAKITRGTLSIKERHILMFWIHVEYEDGGGQGIGGLVLDEWSEEKQSRVGTAYGCEMIRRVLLALGVDDFSEMEGRHIWVIGDGEGFSFKPKGIQKLKGDPGDKEPVMFDAIADEFIPARQLTN